MTHVDTLNLSLEALELLDNAITAPPAERTPRPVAEPHKPWVGLTDDDWQAIADQTETIIWSSLKQAIEAKLKEKNNGTR